MDYDRKGPTRQVESLVHRPQTNQEMVTPADQHAVSTQLYAACQRWSFGCFLHHHPAVVSHETLGCLYFFKFVQHWETNILTVQMFDAIACLAV